MRSSRSPDGPRRRSLLAGAGAALLAPALVGPGTARADARVASLLREGGCVIAFRHALAPGTFDPPGFRVDECSTQRNLSDEGRAQARRIGEWFRAQGLAPAAVRSSPWCRCLDTATLAFGRAERWDMLGSPRGSEERVNAERLGQARRALAAAAPRRGIFEVWVTHMFVLADLTGENSRSGEGLVLRPSAPGAAHVAQVLARLAID